MSHVYVIGDLHFGHKHICKFRKQFPSEYVHRIYLRDQWNSVVTKRDCVYVLGDAAFTVEGLQTFREMQGRKILVGGNHDTLPAKEYLAVFDDMYGAVEYRGFWFTHIPIHPQELYRRKNIHGHCHRGGPEGHHYFNACADFLDDFKPKKFQEIVKELQEREDKFNKETQLELKHKLASKHKGTDNGRTENT